MAVVSIATLKSYFETGDFPTQSNFTDLIDTLNLTTTGFIQNGNSFGANAVLGTNDAFSLAFETNNVTRISISSAGVVTFGLASTTNASLIFANASNANTITINTGATGASYSLTLPTAQGGASTFLQNNGSGVLSWAAAASGLTVGTTAIASGTAGAILFEGAGNILQEDASNLFWDDTNNRLGVGTNAPAQIFHAAGTQVADSRIARISNTTNGAVTNTKAALLTFYADGGLVNTTIGASNTGTPGVFVVVDDTTSLHNLRILTGSQALFDNGIAEFTSTNNYQYIRAYNPQSKCTFGSRLTQPFHVYDDLDNRVLMTFSTIGDCFIGDSFTDAAAKLHVMGAGATSATYSLKIGNSASDPIFHIRDDKNIAINTSSFQASMVGGMTLKNGTAPSGNVADQFAFYSADQAAGNAAPHFRTENGDIIKVFKGAAVADAAGGATIDAEARTAINTLLARMRVTGGNGLIAD